MLNFFIYIFWWNKPRNVGCPIRVYKTSTAEHKGRGGEVEVWEDGWMWRSIEKIIAYAMGFQDGYVDHSQNSSLPMFWSGVWDDDVVGVAFLGVLILGAGFGAIHFIAWYSEFPSRAELILWRVSCIVLTAVPLTPYVLVVLGAISGVGQWVEVAGGIVGIAIGALFPPLYIASRIATLLIALTSLRSIPDAAFITVDWTTFIPHI
jgi:hypothetical protein